MSENRKIGAGAGLSMALALSVSSLQAQGIGGSVGDASVESKTPATASAEVKAEASTVPEYAGLRATRPAPTRGERDRLKPYMQRYLPEGNLWEVGLFAGILFPSSAHNLKVQVLPREEYSTVAMEIGGRVAYYPLPYLGLEAEGFGGGGSTKTSGYSALFYSARAHVIGQLPFWSIVPFVLVGGGVLGASSETMGHDRDPAFHFGAGVKAPINHYLSGRFDVRDIMSQKGNGADNGSQTHYPELHLGMTFTFDRSAPAPRPDRDYDGLYDDEDKCPDEGFLTIDGCSADSDGDGLVDSIDRCPSDPGPAPSGCPNMDKDGDGVLIPADKCPEVAGIEPDGCPDEDPDKDGFVGDADKCPLEAENRNGFQDDDGCPDEMPEAMARFTGVIRGVNFRQGTAEIEKSSFPTLDSAVDLMKKYPSVRIEVSGHTSSEGADKRNQELSDERAGAVRDYFVKEGVGDERVVARGAGASEPIADNATKDGREQNRRIEFRVLSQE